MAEKLTTLARRLRPFFLNMFDQQITYYAGVSEGPDIDIVAPFTVGRGGDRIITFDYDAAGAPDPVAEYAPTSAGLDLALAATAPLIWLYGYTIDGNHAVPDGYWMVGNNQNSSILSGLITLGNASGLANLSVVRTANDANDLYGVLNPVSGTGYLRLCRVAVTQSGAGNAYAVGATRALSLNNGDMNIKYCDLEATSVSGSAYCGRSIAGRIYSRWNKTDIFTTDRWTLA